MLYHIINSNRKNPIAKIIQIKPIFETLARKSQISMRMPLVSFPFITLTLNLVLSTQSITNKRAPSNYLISTLTLFPI